MCLSPLWLGTNRTLVLHGNPNKHCNTYRQVQVDLLEFCRVWMVITFYPWEYTIISIFLKKNSGLVNSYSHSVIYTIYSLYSSWHKELEWYIPFSQRFPPNPGGHLQPYRPRHIPPLWQPPLHGTVKIKLQLLYNCRRKWIYRKRECH